MELRPDATLDLAALKAHLARRNVSKETWPERLVIVPQLPRAAGGKVAKQLLREDIVQRLAAEKAADTSQ